MGYTHYFSFNKPKGVRAASLEIEYQRAILDCQRIVRAYSRENGGIAGFAAHCAIGAYGGLDVNGSVNSGVGENFILREHFRQNEPTWVKTYQYPYDTVVTACLAVLKHRLGDAFELGSDGYSADWADGVALARRVTRLKIENPRPPKPKRDVKVDGVPYSRWIETTD